MRYTNHAVHREFLKFPERCRQWKFTELKPTETKCFHLVSTSFYCDCTRCSYNNSPRWQVDTLLQQKWVKSGCFGARMGTGKTEFFTRQYTANIYAAQFNWVNICCKTQIDKHTKNKKTQQKTKSTFTNTDWQLSTGTYAADLTAEESLWYESGADLWSPPK